MCSHKMSWCQLCVCPPVLSELLRELQQTTAFPTLWTSAAPFLQVKDTANTSGPRIPRTTRFTSTDQFREPGL